MFTKPSFIGSELHKENINTPVKLRVKIIDYKLDCLLRKKIFIKSLG
jgi:hypothetical protein